MEHKERLERASAKVGLSREETHQLWKHQVSMEFLTADDRELVQKAIAAWKQDPATPFTVELDRVRRLFNLGYDYFLLRMFVMMHFEDRLDLDRELKTNS